MSAAGANLPTETLQLIFSTFCLHCRDREKPQSRAPDASLHGTEQHRDKRSWYSLDCHVLFSLCLVSRRFRNIAQAILYHEFVPGYRDSWRSTMYTWDGRLTSFMRTMAQRQDLAALVKRIYIHPYLLISISDEDAQDALKQAAHAPRIESWQRLSSDKLVTILLANLPNLDHPIFEPGLFPFESIRSSVLHTAGLSELPSGTVNISMHASSQSHYSRFYQDSNVGAIFELATALRAWRRSISICAMAPGTGP